MEKRKRIASAEETARVSPEKIRTQRNEGLALRDQSGKTDENKLPEVIERSDPIDQASERR